MTGNGTVTMPSIYGDLGNGLWHCLPTLDHIRGYSISVHINQSDHGLHSTIINIPLIINQYHYYTISYTYS